MYNIFLKSLPCTKYYNNLHYVICMDIINKKTITTVEKQISL